MTKYAKKCASIILVLIMLFSLFTINTSAAQVEEDYGVMPCWTTIRLIDKSFVISGINSTTDVSLYSQTSTSLKITVNFQKLKSGTYETIETWTETGTGTYLNLHETRLINILCDYRIMVTCKAGSESNVSYVYPS